MCRITVDKLYKGCVEVSFYDIKRAIELHENLFVEYRGQVMELEWESLASKFGNHITSPLGFESWHFKFKPFKTGV